MTRRTRLIHAVVWTVCLGGGGVAAFAQPPGSAGRGSRPGQGQILRIFLECHNFSCDFDYLRTQIDFVDHVRDPRVADVHILVTGEATGGGGREATVTFIGLGGFAGRDDSLRYVTRQTDTNDEVRRGLEQTLKLGLVRYLADTPVGSQLDIRLGAGSAAPNVGTMPVDDRWNFWVFRLRFNGSFSGEESTAVRAASGNFAANRTTKQWKVEFASKASYSGSRFLLSDGDTVRAVAHNAEVSGLVVKSISDHWSAAIRGSASSSTFFNQRLAGYVAGGPEYNVFLYAESTRRKLTIQYLLGFNPTSYYKETIYGRLSENRFDQTIEVSLDVTQPWGQAGASVEAGNYLDDFSKHRLEFSGDLDIRLLKGLSLNVTATSSRVHDQLSLPRGSATPDEILLFQRELATSYQYALTVGISFTFGSIFNNVVNPRFGG